MSTTTTGPNGATPPDFFNVCVICKKVAATDIWHFELQHPQGLALPPFSAGAHITVQLPNGTRRNYSLCGDTANSLVYEIAVKRDAKGRGGSISMADEVNEGDLLPVSSPRNNFELEPRAGSFLFIAGGIGITPILSMMRHLKTQTGKPFKLIYCTRDAHSSAFLPLLTGPEFAGQVQLHHDHGELANAFDFWPLFELPGSAHVYCCGPRGLMDAVADVSGHWPSGSIHFESFGADASTFATNVPFIVTLKKAGVSVPVAADQTILQALRASGHHVPSSCESGTCGSCRTGLMAGEPDHRDMVLNEGDKASNIMVCVSRAKSPELVLDL